MLREKRTVFAAKYIPAIDLSDGDFWPSGDFWDLSNDIEMWTNQTTNFISKMTRKLQFPRIHSARHKWIFETHDFTTYPHRVEFETFGVMRSNNINNNTDDDDDDESEYLITLCILQHDEI